MERGWLDKLEACKGFDNGQKAELRGRLLALQSVGVNPNVTLMESDEDIRRCLDGLYNAHTRPSRLRRRLFSSQTDHMLKAGNRKCWNIMEVRHPCKPEAILRHYAKLVFPLGGATIWCCSAVRLP